MRRRLRQTGGRARKLRGLIELLAPYRWRVVAMFVSLVAATGAALAPAPLAKLAIDDGIRKGDVGALDLIVAAFLASALIYAVASYAQTYLVGWVGQRTLQDLRVRLFAHLQRLSIGFYSRNRAGVIISRMTNDVEALDSLVTDSVVTLFQSGLTLVGTVGILLYLDVKLALLTFTVLPLLLAGSLWFRIVSAGAFRPIAGPTSTKWSRSGYWAQWASRSIPKPGCGIARRLDTTAVRLLIPGGRRRQAPS